MPQPLRVHVDKLWKYHQLGHALAKSDAILVLCSHDTAVAIEMGVPPDRILVENRSTNTGENVLFARRLLGEKGLDPQTFIVVQKPYMERRSFATFRKLWPEKRLVVTSPRVTLDEYLDRYSNEALSTADVVSIMVGDLQRVKLYGENGFQIPQEIPADVWDAFEALVAAGYDSRLVRA